MLWTTFRVAVAALVFASAPALAAEEAVDDATLASVSETATKGYAHPEAATVRSVHKSLATSGTGYCGEVSIENSTEFTVFHVILKTDAGKSVLRLSDFPHPESNPQDATVHQFMRNVGCLR